jgi:hypothetical protein
MTRRLGAVVALITLAVVSAGAIAATNGGGAGGGREGWQPRPDGSGGRP